MTSAPKKSVNHARLSSQGVALLGDPGVTLRLDADLVRACLAEGGFPRAVKTAVGTVWAGPDGKPWRGFAKQRRWRKVTV